MRWCEVQLSDFDEILKLSGPSQYNRSFFRQFVQWFGFLQILEVKVEKMGEFFQAEEEKSTPFSSARISFTRVSHSHENLHTKRISYDGGG